jgi:hypothetical protein
MTVTTVGLVAVLPIAYWLATAVRRVRDDRHVLVVRAGVVMRAHESGWAFRVPILEQFAYHDTEPRTLPLLVRATTRDAAPVILLGEATVSLPTPRPGEAYADPWVPAEAAAQDTISRVVSTWSTTEVTRRASTARAPLRHAVSAAVDEHGVTLLDLSLAEVHPPLVDAVLDRGRT